MDKLSRDLQKNIKLMKELFDKDDAIIMREIVNNYDANLKCFIIMADGMVNTTVVNESIIRPLLLYSHPLNEKDYIGEIAKKVVFANSVKPTDQIGDIVNMVQSGGTAVLVDKCAQCLLIDAKGFERRAVQEPQNEKVLFGPKEGFTENIMTNIGLMRRKIKSEHLKFEFTKFGDITKTTGCLCYLDDIVNQEVLAELKRRLETFDYDSTLDVNYLNEFIRDSPHSVFDTTDITERPDTAAGKILEGRIAIILDGTPDVLTVPFLFLEVFQSSDDYYKNHYFAAISRILRIIGYIITITLPAFYLALLTYHQEMIPTNMLLSIAAARKNVPFPTFLELLLLMFAFEILKEAGIRMPSSIGQTLSIVGALVLGQASVEAQLASAPLVIIVAITGTVSMLVPKMRGATMFTRYALILLAALFGFYGIVFGLILLLTHLCSLKSFGVPYLSNITPRTLQEAKDTIIRAPWPYMRLRPTRLSSTNIFREKRSRTRS